MTTRLEKPVRRELAAATMGLRYGMTNETTIVVSMDRAGLSFRTKGKRWTMTLPWREAYRMAEHYMADLLRQEKLRDAAVKRHVRRV